MAKFCEDCGLAFSKANAKFCGNCGAPTQVNPTPQVQESIEASAWDDWVTSYKPFLNPSTSKNEALFGFYFPYYGASQDWIAAQDFDFVWSIFSYEDFGPLTLKSGKYDGPNVIGYVFCSVGVPEDQDIELALPDEFSGFQKKVILCLDADTQKWRPCLFELKGDATSDVIGAYKPGFDDRYLEFQNVLQQQRRQSEQILFEYIPESIEELEVVASKVDTRYFLAVLLAASGWHDNTGVAVHYLSDYIAENNPEEVSLVQVRGRVPEGESHRASLNGGEIDVIQIGWPDSCDHEREEDCPCWVDASGPFYGSADDRLGLTRFQVNMKLAQPIRDETVFRSKTVKKLFETSKASSFKHWIFATRDFDQWSEPEFALAFDRKEFGYNNLSEVCPGCLTLNPASAQVCYSCCHQFVDSIDGVLFAALCRSADADEIASMKATDFSKWVNVYFYVAKTGENVSFIDSDLAVYGY